jgi:uncharacterized LabA/DUF88 family protein
MGDSTERVKIFIDAEYVIQSLRHLKGKSHGPYIGIRDILWHNLIEFLSQKRKIVQVAYYSAELDEKENPETYASQKDYIESVRQCLEKYGVHIRLGRMIKVRNKTKTTWTEERNIRQNDSFSWTQKGIDAKIILDMLISAFKGEYDTAILIAGDSDFEELIQNIRQMGKKCELVTFDRYDMRHIASLLHSADKHMVIDYKTGKGTFWSVKEHAEKRRAGTVRRNANDDGTMYKPFSMLLKSRG